MKYDCISPESLHRAAQHLRSAAATLRTSCTVAGIWGDEYQAERRDAEDMDALATDLDAHADYQADIERMASAPREPRTKEQAARGAAIFRSVAERLEREAASRPVGGQS